MASASLKKVESNIQNRLSALVKRAKLGRGALTRVIYPMYQNAQRNRWMTENTSEGSKWAELTPKYKSYKLRRYGGGARYNWVGGRGESRPWVLSGASWPNYPGSGTKMMIATNRLFNSVTGDTLDDHKVLFTDESMEIRTTVDYSSDANSKRNFTTFGDATISKMKSAYFGYVKGGSK